MDGVTTLWGFPETTEWRSTQIQDNARGEINTVNESNTNREECFLPMDKL